MQVANAMERPSSVPSDDVVFVAYPLRNGQQAIMPHRVRPRSCVRLDGVEKVAYAGRAEARRGCPKHEEAYRCRFCGAWHRATKRRTVEGKARAMPVAWVASKRVA